jgi:hypothetical protein
MEDTMNEYFFYSNTNSKKEAISKTKAGSIEEAVEYFAKTKQIELDEFNKLFVVEKIKN